MKIRSLVIAGFGPFKTEQSIDFSRFDDDGIFLITGKTGAGKSSLLDAICYALYASVPRYDGSPARLRSDHAEATEPSFVELEFEVDGQDYKVRRVPEFERPKARGEGTTTQAHEATLWRLDGETWVGIAHKPGEVGRELGLVLPLTRDQFLQVILLAQNRFQQFLLAKNEERQDVLRTLFGTKRFQDLEADIDERRKVAGRALSDTELSLDGHARRIADLLESGEPPAELSLDWIVQGQARLDTDMAGARNRTVEADRLHGEAERLRDERVAQRAKQQRRDSALLEKSRLNATLPAIETERSTIEAARRAAPVWPLVQSERTAADAAVASHARVERLHRIHDEYQPDRGDHTAARLDEAITELVGGLATLEVVREAEAGLPALNAAIALDSTALDQHETALHALLDLERELPARAEALGSQIAMATAAAALLPSAEATVERLRIARDAATAAVDGRAKLEAALTIEKTASTARLASMRHVDSLLSLRLAGIAPELAAALREGEPCAVCGSTKHPAPAAASREMLSVSEDDLTEAREALAEQEHVSAEAVQAVRAAEATVAADEARAGGRTVGELDAELAAAKSSARTAKAALEEVRSVTAERDSVRTRLKSVAAELVEAREQRAAVQRQLDERTAERKTLIEQVTTHRGNFESVADRSRSSAAELKSARALLAELREAATLDTAVIAASEALQLQVAAQRFDTVDAAVAARLDGAAIHRAEHRIREHDDAVAATAATLAELAADALPVDPIDVAGAETRKAEAAQERDDALGARAAVSRRHDELTRVAALATTELRSVVEMRRDFDQLRALAAVLKGDEPNEKRMRLESYVLAAQLEEIVIAANDRLRSMTSGRFTLEHDDSVQYRNRQSGLGLVIRDEHTGRTRPTHSLSGGETFLASLALALGLAEVVSNQAGGVRLDTLFVDEGFGSLDADTLNVAMATLDDLRTGGRTIGLISHVDAMKEQILAKLRIEVTDQGYSELANDVATAKVSRSVLVRL